MDCTLRASFSAIPFLASRYWPTNCPPSSRSFRNFLSSGAGHSMIPRLPLGFSPPCASANQMWCGSTYCSALLGVIRSSHFPDS